MGIATRLVLKVMSHPVSLHSSFIDKSLTYSSRLKLCEGKSSRVLRFVHTNAVDFIEFQTEGGPGGRSSDWDCR